MKLTADISSAIKSGQIQKLPTRAGGRWGLVGPSVEGTPQGGPLSPLLSNLVLDELDRELERRGHRFVRYADDCVPRAQRAERARSA
jgi:retron-type reverse transcriptase